jgi:hypothetical protein
LREKVEGAEMQGNGLFKKIESPHRVVTEANHFSFIE